MPTRDITAVGTPCWADLMTSDPDRSRAFYGELFGWTSVSAGEDFGGYVNFSKGDALVAGAMRNEGGGMPDGWSVYLATDDAAATTAAVEANGGQVLFPTMEVGGLGTMAVVHDAGSATVGMWQPGLHRGFGVVGEPGTPAWFELFTRDYARTVDFYRKVFRWDAHTAGDSDEFRYTTLGEGDQQAAGIMDAAAWLPEGVPAHWSVYFAVADADATVAKAVELGGALVMGPEDTPYGRIATLTDATGAQFKIVQGLNVS
jgi:predicted enzyme related to lactoylglutathione lyase